MQVPMRSGRKGTGSGWPQQWTWLELTWSKLHAVCWAGASGTLGMDTVHPGIEAMVSPDSTKIAGSSLPGCLPDSINSLGHF